MPGVIHFGQFIRHHRHLRRMTTEALGSKAGISGRRVMAIEAMAEPAIHPITLTGLATALELDPATIDRDWRRTRVSPTKRKIKPVGEEAARFTEACTRAGLTPLAVMKRLRSWFVAQSPQMQSTILTAKPATFTDLVDHVQDPAAAVQARVRRSAKQKLRA